ncbi:MAG: hypothetical protein RL029_958 [Actinomycetota bacterium]
MSENEKQKSISLIVAAAIIALAMGLGLNQVGSGFAARSNEGISVTGSARVTATADRAVWSLNAEQIAPTLSESVRKVEVATKSVTQYLTDGGISTAGIEFGSVSAYPQEEYSNGNSTGRILNYRASRTITVRTDDVELVSKLSNGIGALLQSGVNVSNYGPQY